MNEAGSQTAPDQTAEPLRSPEAETSFLSVRSLHKTYQLGKRTLEVLRGVDLEVRRGEFLALQGASGSGKSTLLHLIGGLDSPSRGEVWFGGCRLADFSAEELARYRTLKIGFIYQAYHVLPELDALENVCLPARIARIDARVAAERGKELLRKVGLGDRMDHKPYELSGGEQQRVAVARSMINHPELILADEPTGNLDSRTGQEILDLLLRLREEHQTTLLIATHDPRVASQAPRMIELRDGRIEPPHADLS